MSKYTDYDTVSQTYDNLRYATGVELLTSVACGVLNKKPEDVVLLEAGCGTGNYSLGLLENGIGSVTMIDGSNGMLKKAEEKVKRFGSKVKEIKQHILPTLPYPDSSFDVITLIEVAHHLDSYHLDDEATTRDLSRETKEKDCVTRYPNLSKLLKEVYRVLRPGGVFVIDHPFQNNIDASWLSLAPKALSIYKQACIPETDLFTMLRSENYDNIFFVQRPGSSITTVGLYGNPECVFDPKFRNSCSEWQYMDRSGELPAVLDVLTKKKAEGKLEQYVHEIASLHRDVGETTLLFAQKPDTLLGRGGKW